MSRLAEEWRRSRVVFSEHRRNGVSPSSRRRLDERDGVRGSYYYLEVPHSPLLFPLCVSARLCLCVSALCFYRFPVHAFALSAHREPRFIPLSHPSAAAPHPARRPPPPVSSLKSPAYPTLPVFSRPCLALISRLRRRSRIFPSRGSWCVAPFPCFLMRLSHG